MLSKLKYSSRRPLSRTLIGLKTGPFIARDGDTQRCSLCFGSMHLHPGCEISQEVKALTLPFTLSVFKVLHVCITRTRSRTCLALTDH